MPPPHTSMDQIDWSKCVGTVDGTTYRTDLVYIPHLNVVTTYQHCQDTHIRCLYLEHPTDRLWQQVRHANLPLINKDKGQATHQLFYCPMNNKATNVIAGFILKCLGNQWVTWDQVVALFAQEEVKLSTDQLEGGMHFLLFHRLVELTAVCPGPSITYKRAYIYFAVAHKSSPSSDTPALPDAGDVSA
jgi:hypothetical protein